MNRDEIASITSQDIRRCIIEYLQQRKVNNGNYKSEIANLAKAEEANDLEKINEAKANLSEIENKFEFNNWLDDVYNRRLSWLSLSTHLSKGIHPSSKGSNANYNTQTKSVSDLFVSSATVKNLPYDASGSAAALDIFGMLNQKVNQQVTLLELINSDHPAVTSAFSDDESKAKAILSGFKKLLNDDWQEPQSSELNKQFYWPNADKSFLSSVEGQYRILIPLHPSALCYTVYQTIQQRFSDENKLARDSRNKNQLERKPYFRYVDLAVVKIGGSNAQNASQLIGSQMGRNFLLPSIPPIFTESKPLRITKTQVSIFDNSLYARCRNGFDALFEVVKTPHNNVDIREKRKVRALRFILAQFFNTVKKIRQTFPAGWSVDYCLSTHQKFWLDPKRAELPDQSEFKRALQQGDWLIEIQKEFAEWVNARLRKEFSGIDHQFTIAEHNEWQREFEKAVARSKRKKEGLFDE
ncbi:type I-F CRISPR-associated protein Csy1 [Orbaceae bacterium ac157xtp]